MENMIVLGEAESTAKPKVRRRASELWQRQRASELSRCREGECRVGEVPRCRRSAALLARCREGEKKVTFEKRLRGVTFEKRSVVAMFEKRSDCGLSAATGVVLVLPRVGPSVKCGGDRDGQRTVLP